MAEKQFRQKRETLEDRVFGDHELRVSALERRENEDFIVVGTFPTDADTSPDSPPFMNGWGNVGAPYAKTAFHMDVYGKVHLRGALQGGAAGTVAFVLPAEYRPTKSKRFIVSAGLDGTQVATVQVDPSGDVKVVALTTVTGGTAGGVLSGTFPNPGFASDMASQAELDAHINDAAAAHAASAISYAGGTGMSATDIEAAVDELATEKANTASAVMDGDTAGGVLSGTFPNPGFASDMASQAELDAHINDAAAAHAASAISYAGGTGMSATDIEAAVDELATEKANTASAVMDGDTAGGVLSGTFPNPGFAATAWTSYTPTWTAIVTNPVIGNGTIQAAYIQIGKIVFVRVTITGGTTTTWGSGGYAFSLPVAVVSIDFPFGLGMVKDVGIANYSCSSSIADTTHVNMLVDTTGLFVGPTIPISSPGAGDIFSFMAIYEAA